MGLLKASDNFINLFLELIMEKVRYRLFFICLVLILVTPCLFSQDNTFEISAIRSSGFLPPDRLNSYSPANLFDGKLDTLWAESSSEEGIGEYVKITLGKPRNIDQIEFYNGYRNPDYYAKNNRVSIIEIDINGEYYLLQSLTDTPDRQVINLPESKYIHEITFIIRGVYRGSKWNDTCISEIGFLENGKQLTKILSKDNLDCSTTQTYSSAVEHYYDLNAIEYKRITEEQQNGFLTKRIIEDRSKSYWQKFVYENGVLSAEEETEADKCPGNQGEFRYVYKDGRIVQVIETRNFEEDGENPILHDYTYSEFGVSQIRTTQKGSVICLETNTYGRNGSLVRKEITYTGRKPIVTVFSYAGGKLVRSETTEEGKSVEVATYQYAGDLLLRKVGLTQYGNKGSIEYYYNPTGKIMYELSISNNGRPESINSYSYNADGNVIAMTQFGFWFYSDTEEFERTPDQKSMTGKFYLGQNYQSDLVFKMEDGKVLQKKYGYGLIINYVYNADGQLVEENSNYGESKKYTYLDGRIDTEIIIDRDSYQLLKYQYDACGLVVRKVMYDRDGKYIGVIVVEYKQ